MLLRPRQRLASVRCVDALVEHDSALLVAATGAGKTIILSDVGREMLRGRLAPASGAASVAVLQHRDKLLEQNRAKFRLVVPGIDTGIYDAGVKSWAKPITFVMEPTLRRSANLRRMPPLTGLIVDEAHHVAAPGFARIVARARELNPRLKTLGVTATPDRGDGKGLDHAFAVVADQITVPELIESGHLVAPRAYGIDVGLDEQLKALRKTRAGDFDMEAVERLMNTEVVHAEMIRHWREKAAGRRTVVFCSTVDHAEGVAAAANAAGVSTVLVHYRMTPAEADAAIERYERGEVLWLVNVGILVEGFDDQTTSCVILLRPCSHKGAMIQMIGRGLRVVDPDLHPGVVKIDCVVLDFGRSLLKHGHIHTHAALAGKAAVIRCPACSGLIASDAWRCDLCGEVLAEEVGEEEAEEGGTLPAERRVLDSVQLVELDIINASNFKWVDLFGDGQAFIAAGFAAWAVAVVMSTEEALAIGGRKGERARMIGRGALPVCLAVGDDWLNAHEDEDAAHKSRRWLTARVTDAQLPYVADMTDRPRDLDRYTASCLMTWKFNERTIVRIARANGHDPA